MRLRCRFRRPEQILRKSRNERTVLLLRDIIDRLLPGGAASRLMSPPVSAAPMRVNARLSTTKPVSALIETAHLDRLALGKGATLTIASSTIAIFKVDGVIYATEAWCLRCGTGLAEGSVESRIVTCSGCNWRYDVTTGSVIGIAALRLRTFDVRVVGRQIIVADA